MKRIAFILLVLFAVGWQTVYSRLPLGEWQAFMAYSETSSSVFFAGKVYAVSNGSLFSYDPEDGDILTYDIVYPMSDVEIRHLAVCESQKTLVIIYENGNIDLMDAQGEVYNMTDLKNSSVADKTVNNVNVAGDKAYLATNFGVVVLDVRKRVIAVTYTLDTKVNATTVNGEYLLAATPSEGLYSGRLTDNLLDKNNWKLIRTNHFSMLQTLDGVTYACISGNSILTVAPDNGTYEMLLKGNFTFLTILDKKMFCGNASGELFVFDTAGGNRKIEFPKGVTNISYGCSVYWLSGADDGLAGYKLEGDAMQLAVSPITFNAPRHNLFYQMFMHNGKLYTCGGGLFYIPFYNPGTIQVLDNSGNWQIYQEEGVTELTGARKYDDIASIAVDPFDENHLFAASSGYGVYEFQDGKVVKLYTPQNSSISHDYRYETVIYPNGVKFDPAGNLWILCAGGIDAISIYTKDKRWISLYYEQFSQKETLRGTFFDSRGWMWAVTPHIEYNGVFMLNTNGTLENTSDDHCLFMNQFYNQDGDLMTNPQVHCAIEDKEGVIWLGTTNGTWLITNPTQLMADQKSSVTITQVKVPRNDGTNYADYLLAGLTVKAIAVDGANRKWVGTEKNGLYLLSADGIEEIHHFTTENSPLLSDEIQSIAVDDETGLVYIGTPKGLIAYQSDATEAKPSFDESRVRAFPNPVTPDYQGYVNIVGLMMNSQVKITDAYGSLIHEGVSVGGSFAWNGRDSKGRRVASGVYHVMATDEEGKEGIVTKIVMIK